MNMKLERTTKLSESCNYSKFTRRASRSTGAIISLNILWEKILLSVKSDIICCLLRKRWKSLKKIYDFVGWQKVHYFLIYLISHNVLFIIIASSRRENKSTYNIQEKNYFFCKNFFISERFLTSLLKGKRLKGMKKNKYCGIWNEKVFMTK